AAAIECLFLGWPGHEKLKRILDAARTSAFPRLRLVAIAGRVHRGEQNDEDRDQLFQLGMGDVGLDHRWQDLLVRALAKGWGGSAEVKQKCFDAIKENRNALSYYQFLFDADIAKAVLLTGFPQDDEVANYFAREELWDHTRLENLLLDDNEFFDLIVKQFSNH